MELMQSMFDGVSWALFLNRSTLSGCIDVIVVKHPDGTLKATPFHVRFGKMHLLYSSEKVVEITVNNEPMPFNMKLGAAGEAFFVREVKNTEQDDVPQYMSTSPIGTPSPRGTLSERVNAKDVEEQESVLLASRMRQMLQENPEAVAEMIAQEQQEASEAERDGDGPPSDKDGEQKFNWHWGWGSLPRIQSNDKMLRDSQGSSDADQREEAVITVSDTEEKAESTLFSLFKRPKPEYLSTSDNSYAYADYITSPKGQEVEEDDEDSEIEVTVEVDADFDIGEEDGEGNDVFFDMDEVAPDSPPAEYFSAPGTPMNGLREDGGLSTSEYHTIFTPLQRDPEYGTSPSRNELTNSFANVRTGKAALSEESDSSLRAWTPEVSKKLSVQEDLLHSLTRGKLGQSDLNVELSMCSKELFDSYSMSLEKANEIFNGSLVTHEALSNDPALLTKTQDLAVRIQSHIFPWKIAFPALMSALLFDQPLDVSTLKRLEEEVIKKQDNKRAWISWLYPSRWRKAAVPGEDVPKFTESEEDEPVEEEEVSVAIPSKQESLPKLKRRHLDRTISPTRSRSTPDVGQVLAARGSKDKPPSTIDKIDAKMTGITPGTVSPSASEKRKGDGDEKLRKSLRPTLEQIQQMNLKPGANSISFSVNTELRGTQTLVGTIYLWDHDAKLVISDIDGTITRSDALGHVLPMVGRDWSQSGVAKLFSAIREAGYHIVYLTSRAIGQAQTTRNFINNLRQDGDVYLPKGPIFMSPDRLFWAFNREIIRRKPEEFKIACLQDIARTFPVGTNPFNSGFGNRPTDLVAYQAAGVPTGRVFIINPSGTITTFNRAYKSTYHSMTDLVKEMYPHTQEHSKGVSQDYNDWNYWKIPVLELDELK